MTAIACLKIFIGAKVSAANQDALAVLVGKVAGAFLESRWYWPRRWGEVAPYTFVIADPRVVRLDAHEVSSLTEELHLKLFGQGGEGKVQMLMFEGETEAVMKFASTDFAELEPYMTGAGPVPGLEGRLLRITDAGVYTLAPAHELGPLPPPTPPPRVAPAVSEPDHIASFRGVYSTRNQSFVGGVVQAARVGSAFAPSVVDGPGEMPPAEAVAEFDEACINAAVAALPHLKQAGVIFVPIAYQAMVHKGERANREAWLSRLRPEDRPRLAVTVYDTPRDPPYPAIVQLQSSLRPFFSYLDLSTSDPDFQIEKLANEAVNSVTLSLPDAEPAARMAAAQRFIRNREAYQRRRIWPALTNVRLLKEAEAFLAAGMPFLSGTGIGEAVHAPIVAGPWPKTQLPMVGEPELKRRRFAGPGGL
jgi:hypothetical protein